MAFARMKSLLRNLLHKQREERELDKEVRCLRTKTSAKVSPIPPSMSQTDLAWPPEVLA